MTLEQGIVLPPSDLGSSWAASLSPKAKSVRGEVGIPGAGAPPGRRVEMFVCPGCHRWDVVNSGLLVSGLGVTPLEVSGGSLRPPT